MSFRAQPEGSVTCGVYAIYNAHVWQGKAVNLGHYTESLWNKLETNATGISGSKINPHIKRLLKTDRIKFPTLKDVLKILGKGSAIVLRYKWEVDEDWGTHYTFIFKEADNIMCVNPHRNENGIRAITIQLTHEELEKMLKKQKVGNNQYPWVWPVPK